MFVGYRTRMSPCPAYPTGVEEAPVFIERTSVGLDVHARSIVAAAIDGVTGEVVQERLVPDPQVVIGWLLRLPGPVAVTYEAGPTGFGLARAITAAGLRCQVAAPSKLLRPARDRVKTDARDAVMLARLLRLDEIVAVRVPTITQEAARDLVRAREDVRGDLMRARHRVSKLALRHGHVYYGGKAWTLAHDAWLRRIRFEQPGTAAAFEADYEQVQLTLARRDRLDTAITMMAADSEFTPVTRRLCCLRGISTLTGFALAVEIGDWHRLSGATIGSYLGLVPTERSSGEKRSQGGITKTGNTHARRLLTEAAWHHKPAYRRGKTILERWSAAPAPVVARADAGNRRLHARWVTLDARKKKHTVACTAIARELAGWCWSLAVMDD
nr:IS110 family transposase [Phycicoccus duodecadis]